MQSDNTDTALGLGVIATVILCGLTCCTYSLLGPCKKRQEKNEALLNDGDSGLSEV